MMTVNGQRITVDGPLIEMTDAVIRLRYFGQIDVQEGRLCAVPGRRAIEHAHANAGILKSREGELDRIAAIVAKIP